MAMEEFNVSADRSAQKREEHRKFAQRLAEEFERQEPDDVRKMRHLADQLNSQYADVLSSTGARWRAVGSTLRLYWQSEAMSPRQAEAEMARMAKQPYNGKIPAVRGSQTSEAAAESMKPHAGRVRKEIYRFIFDRVIHGATDDEIEEAMGLRHQTASARRRELVLKGMVVETNRKRKTRSGRNATVWMARRWVNTGEGK